MKRNKAKFGYSFLLSILLISLIALSIRFSMPSTVFVREGDIFNNKISKIVNTTYEGSNNDSKNKNLNVNLFGILKIKSISVNKVPAELSVYPGGQPIGVKLNTKGVLVVGLSDLEGEKGKITSPAAVAGIELGDSILEINGENIESGENISSIISKSNGEVLKVKVERKDKIIEKEVKAKKTKEGNYKIGLWVRDSTTGVGTLTFYDDKTKTFAALGHPITDIDTGVTLKVDKGEIVPSSIISIKKGLKGNPGELKGIFLDDKDPIGNIKNNTECGIFGNVNNNIIYDYNRKMKVALRDEIKEGPAYILTTIQGERPKKYSINIEKLLPQGEAGPKSMLIKVTDKELLNKTGGIVQGMSGSPIIQNDKIVGAVTHVLINKPDTGYGIYIEWMLRDSNIIDR
ncbi:SpoIVB peptidase [Clostridium cochlearium]|uniref:SpoIVB peptidase. Serine peptidase. MEROPS family S55 n=1 Tax=Clostridium cochlearium TaxID=1494 RepID=A0A240A9E9_CLOCO|nr:SpoIVB peptidase [Clostridium cochlearium]MBV1816987.1 SpoIVB peptidase [Bacteroidales bacterium MSK.15.36]NSJ90757.1 SpoIVB peptidase [Coprococcus sp. MSK.21.13]MBE6065364.1 SpoIVB peptidase [Clostridium cochlearium]MCG4570739.1 SpoIVB peptidase [Clostridium cochlearium]MCG4579550.1 SpoIVB peptidase [Clostridium cochlearium]